MSGVRRARARMRAVDQAQRALEDAEAAVELRADEPCPYCGRTGKEVSAHYRVIVDVPRRSGKVEPIVSEPYSSKSAAESEMNSLLAVGYKARIERVHL